MSNLDAGNLRIVYAGLLTSLSNKLKIIFKKSGNICKICKYCVNSYEISEKDQSRMLNEKSY